MDSAYKCDKCNSQFPDKQTATEHRNATGHPLSTGDTRKVITPIVIVIPDIQIE